jgi:hypothetical protein
VRWIEPSHPLGANSRAAAGRLRVTAKAAGLPQTGAGLLSRTAFHLLGRALVVNYSCSPVPVRRPKAEAVAVAVAVIGLGRLGGLLALDLAARGSEVLGIDCKEGAVRSFSGKHTQVSMADSTDEEEIGPNAAGRVPPRGRPASPPRLSGCPR